VTGEEKPLCKNCAEHHKDRMDEVAKQIQTQIKELRKSLGKDFQTAEGVREAQAEGLEWVLAVLDGDGKP
jgi:hypothetical protein